MSNWSVGPFLVVVGSLIQTVAFAGSPPAPRSGYQPPAPVLVHRVPDVDRAIVLRGARAETEGSVRLLVQPESEAVDPAEPVIVQVTIRNTGVNDVVYDVTYPEWDFRLKVTHRGVAVPLTAYGKIKAEARKRGTVYFWVAPVVLKPGETGEYHVLVNQMYDLSIPESYQIQVSRVVGIKHGHSATVKVLVSEPVTVKVRG